MTHIEWQIPIELDIYIYKGKKIKCSFGMSIEESRYRVKMNFTIKCNNR